MACKVVRRFKVNQLLLRLVCCYCLACIDRSVMADDNLPDERLYAIDVRDYAAATLAPPSTAPTTRRTSVSSEGTMSRNQEQEQQSSYGSMQASQGSLQSQGDNTVRRPRPRQDYGMAERFMG